MAISKRTWDKGPINQKLILGCTRNTTSRMMLAICDSICRVHWLSREANCSWIYQIDGTGRWDQCAADGRENNVCGRVDILEGKRRQRWKKGRKMLCVETESWLRLLTEKNGSYIGRGGGVLLDIQTGKPWMKKRKKKVLDFVKSYSASLLLASQSTFLIRAGSMRLTKSARIKVKFEETQRILHHASQRNTTSFQLLIMVSLLAVLNFFNSLFLHVKFYFSPLATKGFVFLLHPRNSSGGTARAVWSLKIKSNIFSDLRTRTLIGFLPDNDVRWQKEKRKLIRQKVEVRPAKFSIKWGLIFNEWQPTLLGQTPEETRLEGQRVVRSVMISIIKTLPAVLWNRWYKVGQAMDSHGKTKTIQVRVPFLADSSWQCSNSRLFLGPSHDRVTRRS